MLNIKTLKITYDIPFQMYLLSDRKVKRLCKEFEFHNMRIYNEESAKKHTVCIDYPEGNLFWYVDFKKYVVTEILAVDNRYEKEWKLLLLKLKVLVKEESDTLKKSLESITPALVSKKCLEYNLRDYQAHDMLELLTKMNHNKLPAGLILSEQRTGKTRVAVATCIEKCDTGSTILVVCPKSAQAAWFKEFEEMNKYRKNELFKVTLIKKIKDIKDVMEYHSDCLNVRIITNGLFKILSIPQIRNILDLSQTKKVMFISDESHILRNFKTMQSDAIFNFKDICVRNRLDVSIIGITGTPAIKEDSDVFGVLSLINFSKIQFRPYEVSFNMFKEHFYNCEDTSYGKKCKSLRREQELTYLLETNSVQSKKKSLDIFRDYKVKYLQYTLEMDATQKEIYESVRDTMEFGTEIDCMNDLVQLTRLQQICIDPSGLVSSYDQRSPKIEWITKFVKKNTSQMIIMAKKRQPLDRLEQVFTEEGITFTTYNGSLNVKQRAENEEKFHKGDAQVFLIQLDAGRFSLTLPEAKCTVFLDRDFAPGHNDQAEARMSIVEYEACTKYVIDLVMRDTVEEGIYNVLVNKKESIDSVNTIRKITRKEK